MTDEDKDNPNNYRTAQQQMKVICDHPDDETQLLRGTDKALKADAEKTTKTEELTDDLGGLAAALTQKDLDPEAGKRKVFLDSLIQDDETKKLAKVQTEHDGNYPPALPVKTDVPYATQMRIEKADEEELYFKRGDVALKSYHQHIDEINIVAKEEFGMEFHDYLSLNRRADALDQMRREKAHQDRVVAEAKLHPDPSLTLPASHKFPTTEEIGKIINDRIGKAMAEARKAATENNNYEQKLKARDREIERLQRRLDEKSPEQKIFERKMHRKSKNSQGLFNIRQLFRFPLTQGIVEKLYGVDQSISEFLLDIGSAEYEITNKNIISTAARRLMKVRTIDEPEMFDTEFGKKNRWTEILDRVENPKKYHKG